MRKYCHVFALAFVLIGFGLFADANNRLVSFSSEGPDKYADGSVVLDGEWYALVWSADGNFNGFNPDCGPVDPNDAVVIVAPIAKNGGCPYTVFQVKSTSVNFKTTGTYAVYLLDTRSADRKSVATANEQGKPSSVNGVCESEKYTAVSGSVAGGASNSWNASDMEGYEKPHITAIRVDGAKVTLSVEGLLPSVKYNVQMGKDMKNFDVYGLEIPAENVSTTDFVVDAADSKYFKIVREPLAGHETGKEEK